MRTLGCNLSEPELTQLMNMLDEDGNVQEGSEPKTQDWWAVGTNCCNPSGEGFTCGESARARSHYPVDRWSSSTSTPFAVQF